MVVDGGILGLQIDGALEVLHRLFVVADAVVGPAEGIDDVAVVGTLLDGALDHLHALVEVHALVDPGIAEIVQHVRLVGLQLERLLHVGFGLGPLLGAFLADAAIIVPDAVGLIGARRRQHLDALRIGRAAVAELLAAALDVAERHDGFEVLGILGR